ncbi:hypothetical protein TIFTF001_012388 [Ficus carica]|uniref:Uncharacterized protein n=1 Tax=Ficus carica TaxID=3494 RepID=A0AA88AC78_FICCA|nr:hypothetical protein TIFTF001_012388 [Ficus carica]
MGPATQAPPRRTTSPLDDPRVPPPPPGPRPKRPLPVTQALSPRTTSPPNPKSDLDRDLGFNLGLARPHDLRRSPLPPSPDLGSPSRPPALPLPARQTKARSQTR